VVKEEPAEVEPKTEDPPAGTRRTKTKKKSEKTYRLTCARENRQKPTSREDRIVRMLADEMPISGTDISERLVDL